ARHPDLAALRWSRGADPIYERWRKAHRSRGFDLNASDVSVTDGDHQLGLRYLHSVERGTVGDPGLRHVKSGDGGRRLGSARHSGDGRRRSYGQPDLALLVRDHRRRRARGFQKLRRLRATVRGDLVRHRDRGVYIRSVLSIRHASPKTFLPTPLDFTFPIQARENQRAVEPRTDGETRQ